jgi:hypothetical protein
MKNSFLFFLFLSCLLTACRTTKQINKVIQPKTNPVDAILQKAREDSIQHVYQTYHSFQSRKIDFQTFQSKIKIESFGANGKNQDITAVIKMVKDSAIWVSLSATILSVEVYRVLIKPDSVILLNKQEKEVQFRSLDYLQEITQIPFDFKTLQDFILGNPIFIGDSIQSYRQLDMLQLFSTLCPPFKHLITLSGDQQLLTHSKLDDLDKSRSRTADITYDQYDYIDNVYFASSRQVTVSEKNKLDLRLNFKQPEFNKPLPIVFNIPKHYVRK